MQTVPLHGPKAQGRVALVDDEDYDLVMRFRWNAWEARRASGSLAGPYARTTINIESKKITVKMHRLITGYPQTDHINHDTLDNQRLNLRPVTHAQNMANVASKGGASAFKGIFWQANVGKWVAAIRSNGVTRTLGYFVSEEAAARAYDAAAFEIQGEYALLNFPKVVPAADVAAIRMREYAAFAAQRQAYQAAVLPYVPTSNKEWWARREADSRTCTVCGAEYFSTSTRPSFYCGDRCNATAKRRRNRAARCA